MDAREKRLGHITLPDSVEGERTIFVDMPESYELPDENLMNKLINNVPFKNIPVITMKCTRNNTKIALVDGNGKLITYKSCGSEGFKNCRKGTTVAAQAVANRIISVADDFNIDMVRLVFNGLGPGREAAFKVLSMSKLNIISLTDRTQAAEPFNNRPRAARSI